MTKLVHLGCLLAAALTLGCEPTPQVAPTTKPAATRDLDRMRALPYAGAVEEDAGSTADGVIIRDANRSAAGVTLYTANKLCLAELIDENGVSLKQWRQAGGLHWYQADLQPNGDVLVVGCDPSKQGEMEVSDEARFLARYSWDGKILWKRFLTAHHDVETTPSGNLLTLTIRRRLEPAIHPSVTLRDEAISLLSADGTEQGSISLYDTFRHQPDAFAIQTVKPSKMGEVMEVDLIHANSIEWSRWPSLESRDPIYGPNNVLVCSRHQDRIAIINWPQKRLIWAWGLGEISGPHDAQMLPTGNILLFDNGIAHERSRVIELDPLKKTIVWQYNPDPPKKFFTLTKGSAQRLANGNTLIANSDSGQAFEITPSGEWVWDFRCPHRGSDGKRATIVRAIRYEREKIEPLRAQ